MATGAEDQTLIGQIMTWAAGGVATIGAWLWANTMGRIKALEDDKVSKSDFNRHVERTEHDRTERREIEIKLFDKLDDLKDLIIERTSK